MPSKTSSSLGFWVAVISGGVLILLLASFAWYVSPKRMTTAGVMMPGQTVSISNGRMIGSGAAGVTSSVAPEMAIMDKFAPSPVPPMYYGGGDTAATATPRIIRTASLSLEVKSARDEAKSVAQIADANKGFVESSNVVENDDGTTSAYVTIRVPEDKFEDTISSLTGLALSVRTESINGQDVTEQYTDLQARLTAAQAEEQQYLDILKKATNVQDILSVTQYLSQVRSEIESLQGQLKNLGNQVTYATISVNLTEQANLNIPAGKFDLGRDLKQAGQMVILLGQALLTFAVWFVVLGLAISIPVAIIALGVWTLIKKITQK